MGVELSDWTYKASQHDTDQFEGRATLPNAAGEAWLSFVTSESEAATREKVIAIAKWVYENEPALKTYVAKEGAYDEWAADSEYSEQQFIRALNVQEISVDTDYSFSVAFVPDEDEELFEIMGCGHGPYVNVNKDYSLGDLGFTG